MIRCEALIVGAGPAGSTCARLLQRGGMDVILMDRAEFPRDKPCAGIITPAVLETLEINAESYRQGRLLQEIRQFRTAAIGGREILTRYEKPVAYGVRRWEFDHYLLLRSAARHLLGDPVRSVERVPDGWLVNGRIRARLLIGAGGHYCPVSRLLGWRGPEQVIAAQVTEFALDEEELEACTIPIGVPALFFTEDLQGYGWVLRKGRYLNVGLGSRETRGIPRRTAEFCDFLQERCGLGDMPRRFRGHAYLPFLSQGGRRVVDNGVLVVGDAAGVAYPESGEGILPAVESAILAAHTVLAAHGDYRQERLETYPAALAARFGTESTVSATPTGWMRRYTGAILLSSEWLTRRVVLDRWFLRDGQQKVPLLPTPPRITPSVLKQPT